MSDAHFIRGHRDAVEAGDTVPRFESNTVVYFTPRAAQGWLQDASFDGQRPISPSHVSALAHEMRSGRFRAYSDSIEVRLLGDRAYLIDGQHRLSAIVASGQTVPIRVFCMRVDSLKEITDEFSTIDRGKIRQHGVNVALDEEVKRSGLSKTQINTVSSTGPIIAGGFMAGARTNTASEMSSSLVRAMHVREWINEAVMAYSMVGDNEGIRARKLMSGTVLAVMLVTLRYQIDAAERFWSRLIENDGLRKGEPEHTLSEFLVNTRVTSATVNRIQRGVSVAWNAAFEGRQISFIRVADQNSPIRIAGTPYNGSRIIRYEYSTGKPVEIVTGV